MEFLEIETREMRENFTMSDPQFHDYYELYFLFEGTRELFVENKMFHVPANSFCVIPPFSMHKTEGMPYRRVNAYISSDLLDEEERAYLDGLGNSVAFALEPYQAAFLEKLLTEAGASRAEGYRQRKKYLLHFVKTALCFLQMQKLTPIKPLSGVKHKKKTDALILKVVSYINENYASKLTLEELGKTFFVSVNTLCKRFQDSMNCSVMQYTTAVRLNKAKMYLLTTEKRLEEIAALCGFSSENYFGLVFRRQVGCSPTNYRKIK